MRTCKILLCSIALSLLALSCNAMDSSAYNVSAKLTYQGKVFAAPTVVVNADTPATVKVTGNDGFDLTLTVTELPESKVKVSAKLASAHGNLSSKTIAYLGKSATVTAGDTGMTFAVQRAHE